MSRPILIVLVGLSSYGALNLLFSLAVAVIWRLGLAENSSLSSAGRARRIAWLRSMPSLASAVLVLTVVVPAFAWFEPNHEGEPVGPLLPMLATLAIVQLTSAVWIAIASAVRTRLVAEAWLRAGTPLDVRPPAGVPAYAIDSLAPIVALVGVFSPKLIAARAVIEACTHEELTTIVSHERGHLHAHDNMKRWLMECAPDALRWTPLHHAICAAWHDAAEDAADDVATGGDERARVTLATLLVKIARLAPEAEWPAATASPFVQRDNLARRVRRLLAPETATSHGRSLRPMVALGCAVLLAAVATPGVMNGVFEILEAMVGFGR
jgi:Zn-dependent protease with chaperone function